LIESVGDIGDKEDINYRTQQTTEINPK